MRIELHKVTLHYPDKPPLLDDLDFVLEEGDFALVRGDSGSGKSSLLRLCNRLQEPTAGQIRIDGKAAAELEVTQLRRRLAYVQQTPVMAPGSVQANLLYPFSFKAQRGQSAPAPDALRPMLDRFRLGDVDLKDEAGKLSVGQQQRLALVRALLTEPEVLLCDEPTSALDPHSREIVEDALEQANSERGIGVIMVSHLDFSPVRTQVKVYLLSAGRLQAQPDAAPPP
ncbi:MAG: ATP-binding cassette domain-containing protein [Candidatus Latescibacteria bacterium]|nr:ATP-binding cassette domain-containing protein [Candidatus Latescibacterota bacterium]